MLHDDQQNLFELISTDMFYIRAQELNCKICSYVVDDAECTSVTIRPSKLESAELNNNRLTAGGRMHGAREFIEKKRNIPKEKVDEMFSQFRGVIFGYPFYNLVVNFQDDKETITCDIVRIKGGFKNPFPWIGYAKFEVDFLVIDKKGDLQLIKSLNATNVGKTFSIRKTERSGQIIGRFPDFPWRHPYLNPSDLVDFINGVHTSYMGATPHPWAEIKGNVLNDSTISYLNIVISFKSRTITFYADENLYKNTYEVISHSSMDPWNDEITESTDRYIWAIFSFNEKSLIDIIRNLSTSEQVKSFDNKHVRFEKGIKKSEFEELTGIHLFESIIETSSRF